MKQICVKYAFMMMYVFFETFSSFAQEIPKDSLFEISFEDLMNMEVSSGTKLLQRAQEVSAKVTIIPYDIIQKRGYNTIEDVLADIPGFQFRNIQSINSYVFGRGIPNQNNLMLVLIDGVQINELNSGGFYGGAQYNLDNVERIEVIYGPASVVYGTNAVSGIVNIITKKTLTSQGVDVNAHTGSFNTQKLQLGYGYYNAKNDFGFRISGLKKYSEKGDFGGANGLHNWSDSVYNFENDMSFDTKLTYKSITIGTNYLRKQSSANLYYRTQGTQYREGESLWNIGFLNSYVTYYVKPSSRFLFTHTSYYRNSTLYPNTIPHIVDTSQIRYYRPNYLIGTELVGKFTVNDKFSSIGGISFDYENLAKDYSITWSDSIIYMPPKPPKPVMIENYSTNGFLQLTYAILPQLEASAGGRFDYNTSYDFVYTPSGSLIYKAQMYTIKLLYMEAFRAPKPWDYNWGQGNHSLLPEEMHSMEVTSNFVVAKRVMVETSIYKNRFYNMFVKNNTNTAWINADTINLIGLEAELQYLRKRFQSYINYTYLHFYDFKDNTLEEIAPHTCNAGITYMPTSNITAHVRCNYTSKKVNANILYPQVDDACVFHAKLSYTVQQSLQWFIDVRNILNTEYYHTSNRNVTAYRQPQRTVLIGVTWHLL